jgi:hypothetical protein
MISAKKSIPELEDQTENQHEQLAPEKNGRIENLVKLLIMMLLTYVVIFM